MEEKIEDLEFKWGIKRGVGKNKDVQFYESFTYDGVEYFLYECVYVHKSGEPEPYIGKLIKIWENRDKSKKIKIQWFFRPSEISNWLGDIKVQDNEIFFASGEGVGLANINPLEVIAGKCNIVCISRDKRNPQPSIDELQKADYIFHRLFDVQKCSITDKIGEKVGGLQVKYLFNKIQSEDLMGRFQSDFGNKPSIACQKNSLLLEKSPELNSSRSNLSGDIFVSKGDGFINDVAVGKEVSTGGTVGSGSVVVCKEGNDRNIELGVPSGEITTKETVTTSKVLNNDAEVTIGENASNDSSAFIERPSKRVRFDAKRALKEEKNMHATKKSSALGSVVKARVSAPPSNEKGEIGLMKCSAQSSREAKPAKPSSSVEDRPPKRSSIDSSTKILDERNMKDIENSAFNEIKGSMNVISQAKTVVKYAKDSYKEENLDKNLSNASRKKLLKVPSGKSIEEVKRIEFGEIEVTRRPTNDRSKWFNMQWEDKMKRAQEQGLLVMLQNLDPSYTSGEVEDIIWHAFNENCTAKMVQRNALSCPNSGQAFAIFKNREAANNVIRKLNDGVLLLSSGRPLVGIPARPVDFSKKKPIHVGHLSIGKAKLQMQRDARDAISTAHFSQQNTIEFEMAMEWWLLQLRSKKWWKLLYEKQKDEMRKIVFQIKSKC